MFIDEVEHIVSRLHNPKLLRTLVLSGLSAAVASFASAPVHGQSSRRDGFLLWKKTLTNAAKGTRSTVPRAILEDVRSDPQDCLDSSTNETTKVDGYRLQKQNLTLIAVWGKSSCFCSPTGNCAFWIYRSHRGNYEPLLQTDMVREFGFLQSTTNGLPDLVLWSHDSGQRFPGALWKFDGDTYVSKCSREIVSTYKDVPNGLAEWEESHVESNTCNLKLVPERERAKRHH